VFSVGQSFSHLAWIQTAAAKGGAGLGDMPTHGRHLKEKQSPVTYQRSRHARAHAGGVALLFCSTCRSLSDKHRLTSGKPPATHQQSFCLGRQTRHGGVRSENSCGADVAGAVQ